MEVLAIVRAHISALGGNAMVAFFMTKCVLLHSPHKNQVGLTITLQAPGCNEVSLDFKNAALYKFQGQCLINVGGDVVSVSYFADEKHCASSNC